MVERNTEINYPACRGARAVGTIPIDDVASNVAMRSPSDVDPIVAIVPDRVSYDAEVRRSGPVNPIAAIVLNSVRTGRCIGWTVKADEGRGVFAYEYSGILIVLYDVVDDPSYNPAS